MRYQLSDSVNALKLLSDQERLLNLSFGCPEMDKSTGRTLRLKGIIEVCGESGVGKTNLCLQVCIQFIIDTRSSNKFQRVLYVSTDLFPIKRLKQLTELRHGRVDPDFIMNCISIKVVHTSKELMSLFRGREYLKCSQHIGLVVIDSVPPLFRDTLFDPDNMLSRSNSIAELCELLHSLNRLRYKGGECVPGPGVICVNEVRHKLDDVRSTNVVALGAAWESSVTTRILVEKEKASTVSVLPECSLSAASAGPPPKTEESVYLRRLSVSFSSHSPPSSCYFCISQSGCVGYSRAPEVVLPAGPECS